MNYDKIFEIYLKNQINIKLKKKIDSLVDFHIAMEGIDFDSLLEELLGYTGYDDAELKALREEIDSKFPKKIAELVYLDLSVNKFVLQLQIFTKKILFNVLKENEKFLTKLAGEYF